MRSGLESINDFIFFEDDIEKADIILIPGGSYKELIHKAVDLYKQGYAPYILPSGGKNSKLKDYNTEYDFLMDEAIKLGVPKEAILKEDKAAHTFENAKFSYEVCRLNEISCKKLF